LGGWFEGAVSADPVVVGALLSAFLSLSWQAVSARAKRPKSGKSLRAFIIGLLKAASALGKPDPDGSVPERGLISRD
jgi:hypothetical protein